MSAFTPMRFRTLLDWAVAGLERERSVFGLPQRSFWRGREGFDLSVAVPGGRADTPLGPAAGPHTQLAQNLVVAWLAGSRVLELKTVQVLDRLEIARPCIDAPNEAYNVEWSQELRLEESLEQYVTAWCLIHSLAGRGVVGLDAQRAVREGAGLGGTRFDASVGYDLAGVMSESVARFFDGLADAGAQIHALRESLPLELRAVADVPIPSRLVETVTLSTFHGCPAQEIERIVEHLFERHRLHVVVKLNPTLLGFDAVAHLLHDTLGRRDIVLDAEAFERDLTWDHAVEMLRRLAASARRRGLTLGVKLTNTLVVKNTRGKLAGERVYLSGAPLHPIAIALAEQFARSELRALPMSFSAGVTAENFADTVASGFTPVTTCTDLLQPTGFRRLPRYLKALEAEMERTGARDVDSYIEARANEAPASVARPATSVATVASARTTREAARRNLAVYAAKLATGARENGAATAALGTASEFALAPAAGADDARPALRFLDCDSCNRCTLVCPNGAMFAVASPARRAVTCELVVRDGAVERHEAAFETKNESQWIVDAGFCNACGNCDTFCPERGGPFRVKPRIYRTRAGYAAASPEDGVLIEAMGNRVSARFDGVEHYLERRDATWVFGNHAIEAQLDDEGFPLETRVVAAREGHALALAHFHELHLIVTAVLREVNPISAALAQP